MAKRNAGLDDGFMEIFNREMGFSHPRSVSRRISASEVLIYSLTARIFLNGFVTLFLRSFLLSFCLFSFSDETFCNSRRAISCSEFVYKLWVLDGYVIIIRKSCHYLDLNFESWILVFAKTKIVMVRSFPGERYCVEVEPV